MRRAVLCLVLVLCAPLPGHGQERTPINLSSGTTVTFEKPRLNLFTESDDKLLMLIFRTDSELVGAKSPLSEEDTKQHLDADALEICRTHSQAYIDAFIERHPHLDFNLLGVQMRKPVRKRSGLTTFLGWTAVFTLEGKTCGGFLRDKK